MNPPNNKLSSKGLTFDDVLLIPAYSEVLPNEVELKTKFSRKINLNIPIVSAAMDTVTESKMAIAIAKSGGLGIIHRNLDLKNQILEIKKVKKYNLLVGAAVGAGDSEFKRADEILKTDIDTIWDFASSPANLKEITPDYMLFDITSKGLPEKMYPGMIITYKVSPLLNIKINWITEITQVKDKCFFIKISAYIVSKFIIFKNYILRSSKI